jgi:Cohesin domain
LATAGRKPLIRFLFVLAVVLSFAAFTVRPSSAANSTLSVVPSTQTVNPGASFTVEIKQNAPSAVMGAQTDLKFDAGLVQITDVTRGAAYDGPPPAAFLIGVAPQTKAEAIAEANTTGTLQNVTLVWSVPGTGSVPAGEQTFIRVSMTAKSVGGKSPLTLEGMEMFDTAATPFTVTANNGEVNVTGSTATPTPTPCAECTPSPTPTPTKVPVPTPTPSPTLVFAGSMSVAPNSWTVPPTAEFDVTVVQNANVVTTGAQTDLKFDPAVIQVVDVTKGRPYAAGQLIMGIVPDPPATPPPSAERKTQTIAQANASGTLENVAAFFVPGTPGGSVPPGEAVFLNIVLRAVTDGKTALTLANMEMLNEAGESVGVGANNGEVVVQTGAPFPSRSGAAVAGAVRQPGVLPASGDPSGRDSLLVPALLLAGLLASCAGSVLLVRSVPTESK